VLVVDDKWLARIEQDVQSEMQRISQRLTGRIKELAERYDKPLPTLEDNVKNMEKKVRGIWRRWGLKYDSELLCYFKRQQYQPNCCEQCHNN